MIHEDRAQVVLEELTERSGALTALVVTKNGIALATAGDTSYLDTTALAALIAGMFTATREVARLVGERRFSILLQQGETRHIHVGLITDTTMLVIVFEDHQRIGRVRHEARKAAEQLAAAVVARTEPKSSEQPLGSSEFKEVALNLIDQIFTTR